METTIQQASLDDRELVTKLILLYDSFDPRDNPTKRYPSFGSAAEDALKLLSSEDVGFFVAYHDGFYDGSICVGYDILPENMVIGYAGMFFIAPYSPWGTAYRLLAGSCKFLKEARVSHVYIACTEQNVGRRSYRRLGFENHSRDSYGQLVMVASLDTIIERLGKWATS